MDAIEAREHLEMTNAILQRVPRLARPSGTLLIVWGLVAATLDIVGTLVAQHRLPAAAVWFEPPLLIAAIAFTLLGIKMNRSRESCAWADVQLGRLFTAVFAVGFIASFGATALFTILGAEALWSILYGGILVFIGFCGDRMALAGGLVLAFSVPAAAYSGSNGGFVLAAGFLAGYVALGAYYRLAHADG